MATVNSLGDNRGLAERLRNHVKGEVLFDNFSRGRYSTDASIYQIQPRGVVVVKDLDDVRAVREICTEESVPMLARGGGTSQSGQTVGDAVVIDHSKHLTGILDFDTEQRRVRVQPGVVLDVLNRWLQPHGLFFPVDVSTSSRATIGGMTGNNSCGARSLRYGNMVHNVVSVDAMLCDGQQMRFGPVPSALNTLNGPPAYRDLISDMRGLHSRYADQIAANFPSVLRRVGGYNIDSISNDGHNMAHLLVGSEGTLSWFDSIELALQPIPRHRVLGVCHFERFYDAMAVTRHIVTLAPAAVELVDRIMIDLALDNPSYRPAVETFLKGKPEALLLVEFAGDDLDAQTRRLEDLATLLADHGFADAVVPLTDPAQQRATWEVRKAGLNIMMSMKGDGKPVSFIEDCAVPLEHLADYTDRLSQVFAKHGTYATWYAHASVGCLHVRPVLNMKTDGAGKMRAIAEEAMAMVREYKGSHSGEHGDGLVRSEWHERMFGGELAHAFESVKDRFDPSGLLNPGKIVRAPKMDDRTLFRYPPDYATTAPETALDWSPWGGLPGAVEMCNNNGTCRKAAPGVMCPSYRATGDERHLTRGRANSLRLALSGQLGPDALVSEDMYDTMDLCVSCKGCRRECPTGVDMARMKVEFLHQYHRRHGLGLQQRLIAYLPRYAPLASRLAPLMNLRDRVPGLARLSEKTLGFSAHRSLPQWRSRSYKTPANGRRPTGDAPEVVLLADTFNTYFEPANARAAQAVLEAAGYHVRAPDIQGRPPCCGRTFLAAGLVNQAREEAQRTLQSLAPYIARGVPVVGLEPSCLLTLRDEFQAMKLDGDVDKLAANSFLFEEFLQREHAAGRLDLALKPIAASKALLHGHCHQKAFGLMPAVMQVLGLIPDLQTEMIESSCCGMAGAFGYQAGHYDVSMKMGELSLLPAARAAAKDAVIVADGTSCRHQIHDGAARQAVHVARVLQSALA